VVRDAVAVPANAATLITVTAKPTSFVIPSPQLFAWRRLYVRQLSRI
jgi:hypothetical protein